MATIETQSRCPACGSSLSQEGGCEGLCQACLIQLALESPSLLEELEHPDEEATLVYSREAFSPGQILGKRYRIRTLLGRGGMGEVWRATDLKLRVDVALKALLRQLLDSPRALETLRQEVRVAREVISPNVCRVFDLVELDGQELVSMEYIDGITLLDILKMRAPLDLVEAREIASQFLAGLQAIHDAGLVHRDIKPENLMMTRSGRVVLMDFGIAKGLAEARTGTVSGTPAYMAPEQARGEAIDARTDVFSAGVVLAEMIAPGGAGNHEARRQVWEGIHHEPPAIADSPWAPVLKQAVAGQKEQRHTSAAALARALEEVTLRVAGAEDVKPYPGLAAFTEADAEYFFGRELEVEALWKKLQRPHLLGLIGPSGAGKSSFLRAGLLPVMPTGWRAVIAAPGSRPMTALGQALADEVSGDPEAVRDLLRFEEMDVAVSLVSRWRHRHEQALIIVDQFEELFTQNPPEEQGRLSKLLGRLTLEADVHVLLSMREDFLGFCSQQESLGPIFSELTPLKPLTGAAVRRALVQPALKCGYRFEDDALVEEMVAEVSDERGALPLLAFAASRLWDHRDREQGLLTREAYEHIGGVAGALAQHAEATLEKIGEERVPIVRELFRNLVTAQGTRAARDREELLSVFGDSPAGKAGARPSPTTDRPAGDHDAAEQVLNTLIDARLLTSYEVPAADETEAAHHRIEIIHESLLSNWPRLVRWQTQDADSAQLRDQIRQAAQMWEERGRPEDLLWTGTSFGEYQLWKERYEGGLSTAEESFGDAMVHKAERQKRRRRVALTAAFGILLVVIGVIAWFGWQAELERRRAEAETFRAEAGKLLALGEVEIDTYPTATLAWATKSLELADTQEGRMLALRALQAGPPVTVLRSEEFGLQEFWGIAFSPNGEWLASAHYFGVWLRSQHGAEISFHHPYSQTRDVIRVAFESDEVLVADQGGVFQWLSVPGGEELRRVEGNRGRLQWPRDGGYFTHLQEDGRGLLRWWPFEEGAARLVGSMPGWQAADVYDSHGGGAWPAGVNWSAVDIDESGSWMVYSRGRAIYLRSLENWHQSPRQIGSHEAKVVELVFDGNRERVAARDESGELRIWSTDDTNANPLHTLEAEGYHQIHFDPSGNWLGAHQVTGGSGIGVRLWDLTAPMDADPLTIGRTDDVFSQQVVFHPNRPWMVTSNLNSAGFWPLPSRQPWVLRGHVGRVDDVAFTPDGEWLVSAAGDGVWAWPLQGQNGGAARILLDRPLIEFVMIDVQPSGDHLAVTTLEGEVLLVPMAGGPVRKLGNVFAGGGGMNVTFSPDGRFLAALPWFAPLEEMVIRVWDLESGEASSLGPVPGGTLYFGFDDSQRLRWSGLPLPGSEAITSGGERVFDLVDGSEEIVAEEDTEAADHRMAVSSRGDFALVFRSGPLGWDPYWKSLETGKVRIFHTHKDAFVLTIDPTDQWMVSGDSNGLVRVGPVSGEEPHLLYGHTGLVRDVEISPDGRLVASSGDDGTIRIWPTPDLSEPPLHSLPHDELIAKLHALTNLRIVEDPESATGWKIDYAAFPGWKEVPQW